MNAVNSTWRQLVRKKLWPVAVLLLAALVAVPVLLAREPAAPETLSPVAVNTEADDSIAEPIVAKVTSEDRSRRRRVLGVRKDPFAPAPPKKVKAQQADVEVVPAPEAAPPATGGGTDLGGGGSGSGEPAVKPTFYAPGTIIVRFGEAAMTSELTRFAVPKFGPVPDEEFPLLVYMGLTKDGKKAKFLIDASVEVDGDGDCKPHPGNCETIALAVGETEFLDVLNTEEDADSEEADPLAEEETEDEEGEPDVVASFQLDLVDIKRAGDPDVR